MLDKKYILMAQEIVREHFSFKNKAFIFGSSLRKDNFYDVDIAIQGVVDKEKILDLKLSFEASNFPRPVDIIDFDSADADFQNYVLHKEIKEWI